MERENEEQKKIIHTLQKQVSQLQGRLKLVETFLEKNGNRFANIQDNLDDFHMHSERMRTSSKSKFINVQFPGSPLEKAILKRNLSSQI